MNEINRGPKTKMWREQSTLPLAIRETQIKIHWDPTSSQSEWLPGKKKKTKKQNHIGGRMWGRQPLCTAGRNVSCPSTMEITMESSQKLQIQIPHDDILMPFLGIYLKDSKWIHGDTYSLCFNSIYKGKLCYQPMAQNR